MASENVERQVEPAETEGGFSGFLQSIGRAFNAIIEFLQSFEQE